MYTFKLLKLDKESPYTHKIFSEDVVKRYFKYLTEDIKVIDTSSPKRVYGTIPRKDLFVKDGYLCVRVSRDFFLNSCKRGPSDDVLIYPELVADFRMNDATMIHEISIIQDGSTQGTMCNLQAPPFEVGEEVWCVNPVPYEFKPQIIKSKVERIRRIEDEQGVIWLVDIEGGSSIRYFPDKPKIFDSRESAIQSVVRIKE